MSHVTAPSLWCDNFNTTVVFAHWQRCKLCVKQMLNDINYPMNYSKSFGTHGPLIGDSPPVEKRTPFHYPEDSRSWGEITDAKTLLRRQRSRSVEIIAVPPPHVSVFSDLFTSPSLLVQDSVLTVTLPDTPEPLVLMSCLVSWLATCSGVVAVAETVVAQAWSRQDGGNSGGRERQGASHHNYISANSKQKSGWISQTRE